MFNIHPLRKSFIPYRAQMFLFLHSSLKWLNSSETNLLIDNIEKRVDDRLKITPSPKLTCQLLLTLLTLIDKDNTALDKFNHDSG